MKSTEDRVYFRIKPHEKRALIKDSEKAGFDSVSAFLKWLYRNYKSTN